MSADKVSNTYINQDCFYVLPFWHGDLRRTRLKCKCILEFGIKSGIKSKGVEARPFIVGQGWGRYNEDVSTG